MSHPMEPWLDARREERSRLYARRDAVEERLKPLPLSVFAFEQFADLQVIADRGAPSERGRELEMALDRLEAFLAARGRKPAAKKAKPAARRRRR